MSRGVPTWQNVSAPKFNNAGMIAANKMFTDSLQGIGDAFTSAGQIGLDREDREIAEADRLFKREGDLISRALQGQQQEKNQFALDTQEERFKSDMLSKDLQQQASRNASRNSNQLFNQRDLEAKNIAQQKSANETYADTYKQLAFDNPNMTDDNLNLLVSSYLEGKGYSNANTIGARGQIDKSLGYLSPLQKAKVERAKEEQQLTDTRKTNRLKEEDKAANRENTKKASISGGLGDAVIADTVTSSTTDEFSLNPFSGWDTDKDSKTSATAYANNFKKALGKDYADVVKRSIIKGKFDEGIFNTNMKAALQKRMYK